MEDSDRDFVSGKILGDKGSRVLGLRSQECLRDGGGCAEWQRMHAVMSFGRRNAVEICFGNGYAVRGIALGMCGRRIGCGWRMMSWVCRSGGL